MGWSRRGAALVAVLMLAVGCGRTTFQDVASGDDGTAPTNPNVSPTPTVPPANGETRQIDVVDTEIVGGPHVDFPVAVHLNGAYLVGVTNLYFSSDVDGTQPMDFELESFDDVAGDLLAWVRIPSLTADTTFYVQYDGDTEVAENVPGVWSGDFCGVWHMANDPSQMGAVMRDSSPEANHGDPRGNMQAGDVVAGQLGNAIDFDGQAINNNGDWIDLFEPPELAITTALTIEAWVEPDVAGAYMGIAGKIDQGGGESGYVLTKHDTDFFRFQVNSAVISSDVAYGDTNFHHVVGVRRGGVNYLYVDGVEQAQTNTTNVNDSGSFAHIGRQYSDFNTRVWNGSIDEMRISNQGRSADWISTTFNNAVDPDAFFTVSSEL